MVTALCAIYVWPSVYRGWIPHDIGILAQSAQRILDGELPHRDFDELYTGGLSYFHAFSFQVFGTQLSSIRTTFFLCCLLFFVGLHRVARRLAPPGLGELTVLAAVGWSIPNYFESMPSWYNLFCATLGLAAIFRFIDAQHRGWLIAAGLCGACSVLCKIVGLYFIAAIYVFLAYRRQLLAPRILNPWSRQQAGAWLLPMAVFLVCLVWLTLIWLMVRRNLEPMLFVQLLVPSVAVAATACVASIRHVKSTEPSQAEAGSDSSWKRPLFELLADWGAFSVGVALPLFAFLTLHMVGGALDDLFLGVFVLPFTRLTGATYPFPEGWLALGGASLFLMLGLTLVARGRWDKWAALAIIACAAWLSYLSIWEARTMAILAARLVPPALTVTVAVILVGYSKRLNSRDQQVLFLLFAVASFCAFIQFPFAAPIYFCFVAPLFLLLFQAMCNLQAEPMRFTAWSSALVGLLFAVGYVNPFSFFDDPLQVSRDPPINLLSMARGGIYVSQRDRDVYEALVQSIQAHSPNDAAILATPDCPEVYFISERQNPTRNLIELFEQAEGGHDHVTEGLVGDINVVVINLEPKHSRHLSQQVISSWLEQFERNETIGNFLVCFDRKNY